MPKSRLLLTCALIAATAAPALADTVTTKNNDRLSGTIVELADGQLKLQPGYGGDKITIPMDHVSGITSDKPLRVTLEDGTQIVGTAVAAPGGTMALEAKDLGKTVSVQIDKITEVRQGDAPPKKALRTEGRINIGLTRNRGNTENRNYHGDGEFTARTKKNRFRLGGEFNKVQEDGSVSEDNETAYTRYDHFISKRWYMNSNMRLHRDRMKDLSLRTTAGIGMGYQFLDSDTAKLSTEAGINYIHEDYKGAPDTSEPAGRWAINYQQDIPYTKLVLFHDQEGLWSLENSHNYIITTKTGIRIPLAGNLNATAEFDYDYDNDPIPGNKKEDFAYIFSLGYGWKS